MKISRQVFVEALRKSIEALEREDAEGANYQANLRHNAGRWNYWQIHCVEIDGVTFYCSPCCATANSDISVIRRVCARS